MIEIYTKSWCPYCVKAKALLTKKKVSFKEIDIELHPKEAATMQTRAGRTSVPQIFIQGQHIGGCDDIHALDASGKLDALLKGQA
jgi:glutaredoxin 3